MAYIKINIDIWVTQAHYRRLHPHVTLQTLNGWIKRGQIASWFIPELGITLVKK